MVDIPPVVSGFTALTIFQADEMCPFPFYKITLNINQCLLDRVILHRGITQPTNNYFPDGGRNSFRRVRQDTQFLRQQTYSHYERKASKRTELNIRQEIPFINQLSQKQAFTF
ncbi:hypothetical protein B5L76_08600 [Enterobacter hormaechei subsp. xiangfangensis]|nr:hypothetical protein AM329_21730 [Enterobacter cloacae complex sp. AR_0002]AZU68724.1 hypothetical protein CLM87_19300 [Enterobacter hormaechei subsp. xiangfangensis]KJO95019.1 hypothetical protein SR93_09090 [Enterobacter hormaechei subsp. xiangfangensis]OUQ99231.1 hypothetical protein B5L76_08600 [Enterobacter hormaechei subsp. xiangfangensis]